MKFILEIELGNKAMCWSEHVVKALVKVADTIQHDGWNGAEDLRIQDEDGNTVGKWEVTE